MLKALNNVFRLLFISADNRNKPVCSEAPFALTADKPTRMYVSFYADHVRYDYTIVYTIDRIIREELLYYPKKASRYFMKGTIQAPTASAGSNSEPALVSKGVLLTP